MALPFEKKIPTLGEVRGVWLNRGFLVRDISNNRNVIGTKPAGIFLFEFLLFCKYNLKKDGHFKFHSAEDRHSFVHTFIIDSVFIYEIV